MSIATRQPAQLSQGIVFANKLVFTTYEFHFTVALTLVHTLVTLVGMRTAAAVGRACAGRRAPRAECPRVQHGEQALGDGVHARRARALALAQQVKLFEAKRLPPLKVAPLAAAFVAYIIFGMASLRMNSVGIYQVMKVRRHAGPSPAWGLRRPGLLGDTLGGGCSTAGLPPLTATHPLQHPPDPEGGRGSNSHWP